MFLKKIAKSSFIQYLIAYVIYFYIKLIIISSKTEILGSKYLLDAKNSPSNNIIFAFWHGRLILLPHYLQSYNEKSHSVYSIASLHKDGRMVGKFVNLFGSKIIYGSSNKGGVNAIKKILKILKKKNTHLCISPDGPRGPNMQVGGTIIDIARLTEASIIPISYSVKKARFLNSWDSFMLPKFFNHIKIQIAEPIKIPKKSSKEEIEKQRKFLEKTLNGMTFALDATFSYKKIKIGKEKKKKDV